MSTLKELYKEQIEAYSAAMTADEREDARQRILDILEMMKKETEVEKARLDIQKARTEREKVKADTDKVKAETEAEKAKNENEKRRLDIEEQKVEAQKQAAILDAPFRALGLINPFSALTSIRQQNMNYNMFREEMEYQEKGEIPNRTLDKYISRR